MLAKMTAKSQPTLPESVISTVGPAEYFDVQAKDGQIILTPVRIQRADAVVSMYHDQGRIAMKLTGFEHGVTVPGGLPVPVTACAGGTAFDIVGPGTANVEGLKQALLINKRMAAANFSTERARSGMTQRIGDTLGEGATK